MEPEHGGIATREYYITEDIGWYSERKQWKGLKSFGMVHKKIEKPDGSREKECRYYICSIGENVEEFERAARGHWGVLSAAFFYPHLFPRMPEMLDFLHAA